MALFLRFLLAWPRITPGYTTEKREHGVLTSRSCIFGGRHWKTLDPMAPHPLFEGKSTRS